MPVSSGGGRLDYKFIQNYNIQLFEGNGRLSGEVNSESQIRDSEREAIQWLNTRISKSDYFLYEVSEEK